MGPQVAIVGCPNVGKSVLFNTLTGAYVTVSNYPGTTVEVSRGKGRLNGQEIGVIDTPGMYRLLPITEEERVARRILLQERPEVVVHVADAKNLARMLPMTLQLIEAGLPVVLDLNLMDEAERAGVRVDVAALERALGAPVAATALGVGRGADRIREKVAARLGRRPTELGPGSLGESQEPGVRVRYHPVIEEAIGEIQSRLQGTYHLGGRAIALLLLQDDAEVEELVREQEGEKSDEILRIGEAARARFGRPISYVIAHDQHRAAERILRSVLAASKERTFGAAERLSQAMMRPLTGMIFLALALFALYEFVGVLGAQVLVGFLEEGLFGRLINPWIDGLLASYVPWPVVRNLFGGEYGIITLGVRYAVAIILPIVGTFFIAFSIIEDTGYLPRLAMLIDRVFKRIGLNGRAVIPMVLGFGCDTMATIVTRTLETRRERILSTFLLALAIPCSAQLGVILGLMGGNPGMLAIWGAVVGGVFLLVGYLAARVMPGERPTFYMELPPLRLPSLGNVLVKTYTRMEWYFREVMPVFVIASVIIWAGHLVGAFDVAVSAMEPLMRLLGLPQEAAVAFLFGFFRRDYGAAGLYDMRAVMNGRQLLVAATTLTIFVPCIAQFAVTVKERGWKVALAITAFIFPFAFLVGGLLNWLLTALGVTL